MRILICSTIYPGIGGIPTYFTELSKKLKKEGNEITILAKSNLNDEKGMLFVKSWDEEEIMHKLERVKDKFDLVIVGWYTYLLPVTKYFDNALYIMPSIRSRSLKIVQEYNHTLLKKMKYFFIKRREVKKEREGMRKCKKIIYISKTLKKQAKKDYGIREGKVIYPGIDPKRFDFNKNKKFDILIVSNFDPRKGIDVFLDVYKYLKSNPRTIIVGEVDKGHYIEKIIKKKGLNVTLVGPKKYPEKYYSKAKVFVLPSKYEAFGLVLLEALTSGLPCIVFKPDGKSINTASDEIIKQGKTGFLVKDEKEMAQKIELLLNDKKLLIKMGKSARKEAKKYSWEKCAKEILKLANK